MHVHRALPCTPDSTRVWGLGKSLQEQQEPLSLFEGLSCVPSKLIQQLVPHQLVRKPRCPRAGRWAAPWPQW